MVAATIPPADAASVEATTHIPLAVRALSGDPYAAFIAEASQRFGVPERWVRAVIRVESGGDVRAVSPRGARGLMQVMPATWAELQARHGLGADPFDPHDNIIAGTGYLAEMHARYGMPGALAAYNAGPGRWEAFQTSARKLPPETIAYVAAIVPMIGIDGVQGSRDGTRVAGIADASSSPLFMPIPRPATTTAASDGARQVNDLTAVEAQVLGWASSVFVARRAIEGTQNAGPSAADQAGFERNSPPMFAPRGFRALTR